MSTRKVDVAIIGAGTAGLGARRAVKAERASALMIDPGPFGTTCARVGCMPSKLLIAAAEIAHDAARGAPFGVHAEGVRVDGKAVMRRVQAERDRFVGFVKESIACAKEEGELLEGRAKIVGPGRLSVDPVSGDGPVEVEYGSLVVAAGSTPFVPPPFRGLEQYMLTNEGIFELEDLPESLLVVGPGVIGLELGQAFHRLGVRVTTIGVGGLLGPITDPEVLAVAHKVFTEELDLHTDYTLESIEAVEGGVRIRFVDSTGTPRDETYQKVLMAAGRTPNVNVGFEALGIERGPDGKYPLDPDTLQLGDERVFLAGDVNNLHPLLHEAADDGRIAGTNAARFPDVHAARRRTGLAVVFSDPQIGIVGGGYGALGACEAVAGEVDYGDQGRSRVHLINRGIARIYAERKSGRLLGAEIVGPRAEHLSHLLAWAVQQGLRVDQALEMPFYHPVVEEGIRTALRDLNVKLRRGKPVKCKIAEMGPGS